MSPKVCRVRNLTKDVSSVVGHLVLQHRGDTLHAHASVHMLGWQALQAGICLPVELHTITLGFHLVCVVNPSCDSSVKSWNVIGICPNRASINCSPVLSR